MRISEKNVFSGNGLFYLKNQDWLDKQRIAGKIAAGALTLLKKEVTDKTQLSLKQLNDLAETFIQDNKGYPTFKNYKGFPAGVCISVNKQLVHGIPSDYKLQDGDTVSFDLGVTIDGAIADTALTCVYGSPKSKLQVQLIEATEQSLMKGIESIKVGNKIGCIGYAINRYAKGKGFSIINQYGGHGLHWNTPHAAPFVANKSDENEGFRIQPGLTLAIEPMLTSGSTRTWVDKDGWTVYCDADISGHFEHSIYVHDDHVEIITKRD